jgi:hypothetical protein
MTTPSQPVDALVPIRLAAELSGVTADTILDLVAAGAVRAERIRGQLYVALTDVEARSNGQP